MANSRFAILQASAVSDERVTAAQFRTLAALGTFGDKDGWCYPKLATLGKMLGKSKQAVSKDILALAELGYVQIKHQYREDGSQQNNLYRLVFDTPVNVTLTPHQPHVDPPSTPEVDPPSTSEVDALTTHINDPIELNDDVVGETSEKSETANEQNIFELYEKEIGALTPMIAETLKCAKEDFPDHWIREAVAIAVRNNARSWSYTESILKRWQVDGFKADNRKGRESPKPVYKKGRKGAVDTSELDALIEAGI